MAHAPKPLSRQDILSFIFVGMMWGCTNPFLKRGADDKEKALRVERSEDAPSGIFIDLFRTMLHGAFLLPFAINQLGSLLFVKLLGDSNISMAVPICNSLTFVFTAITSHLLGERINLATMTGIAFILAGVTLCVYSKL